MLHAHVSDADSISQKQIGHSGESAAASSSSSPAASASASATTGCCKIPAALAAVAALALPISSNAVRRIINSGIAGIAGSSALPFPGLGSYTRGRFSGSGVGGAVETGVIKSTPSSPSPTAAAAFAAAAPPLPPLPTPLAELDCWMLSLSRQGVAVGQLVLELDGGKVNVLMKWHWGRAE